MRFRNRRRVGTKVGDWLEIHPRPVPAPLQIPDCVFWFDASDSFRVTNGSGVTEWRDKSGNDYAVNVTTTAFPPSYNLNEQNGNNTIEFSSSPAKASLARNGSLPAPSVEHTLAFVAKVSGDSPAHGIVRPSAIVDNNLLYSSVQTNSSGDYVFLRVAFGDGVIILTINQSPATGWNCGIVRVGSSTITSFFNGSAAGSQSHTTTSINWERLEIGQQLTFNDAVMNIGEVVMYSRAISDQESELLSDYFKEKWDTP